MFSSVSRMASGVALIATVARTVKAEPVWGPQWGVGRAGWISEAWALCWGVEGGGGMAGVDDREWRDS